MTDEITVVKCGGGLSLDHEAICRDLAALPAGRAVLVHGGAAELDLLAGRLGVPQRRLTTPSGSSSRYTDPATLEVLLMALAGKVKPALVASLARHGARPVGLTGMDARLVTAKRTATHRAVLSGRKVVIRDDHSGRIRTVDPSLLVTLLDAGCLPAVSPPAIGEDGEAVNVDADRAAAAIAGALARSRPVRLVLLTAAPGVLRDPADESSLMPEITVSEEPSGDAAIMGGMTAKLQAAHDALVAGVGTVVIADGRVAHPVRDALAGAGTTVKRVATVGSL
ncbi:[LysW]-aminoadipate kinase [Streptomyces sp. NBC_01142]|uniref:[LysW]-aminoadipate kinase n=1 Tax=Streptomyces sp. NBC_01142 TaxID=2975865 RepID=UPI00225B7869|nr:[LysW]-aminoadipate kinase [Streptomyces sp. NBC_01142]MCX4820775.1 [LysW]-aminoadipate kinase [Streptomyces sp. NBC_01142]